MQRKLDAHKAIQDKMKLNKKSQETVGKHIIILGIVLLLVLIAMAYLIWQHKANMFTLIDKIFR